MLIVKKLREEIKHLPTDDWESTARALSAGALALEHLIREMNTILNLQPIARFDGLHAAKMVAQQALDELDFMSEKST